MICGHHFIPEPNKAGKCSYTDCNCGAFTPKEFQIKVNVTLADLFENENPSLNEDDPNYYIMFERWLAE